MKGGEKKEAIVIKQLEKQQDYLHYHKPKTVKGENLELQTNIQCNDCRAVRFRMSDHECNGCGNKYMKYN